MHLRIVVVEELAVGVYQIDEAGVRVADSSALSPRKLLQLVYGLHSLLPVIRVGPINQVSHLFDQVSINGLRNGRCTLVESILSSIEA